jgi:hypothetical protein
MRIAGLDATVRDPADGRQWTITTRTTRSSVTVVASANNGQLALSFERRLAATSNALSTCPSVLAAEVRAQSATHRLRADNAAAFRTLPFQADRAFQLAAGGFAVEYTCIDAVQGPWLVSAMAFERAGVSLADCEAIAVRVAEALQQRATLSDGTIRLTHSQLTLRPQSGDGVWLFTADAAGFPIASDAVSTRAGDSGGATMTLSRVPGRCVDAWAALRSWLTDEGTRTDRPGYVPSIFGSRIRRVAVGERLREVYCAQPSATEALLVTAVFLRDDADAMLHVGEFLRRVELALAPAPLTAQRATTTATRGGDASTTTDRDSGTAAADAAR